MAQKRRLFYLPLILALFLCLGGILGRPMHAPAADQDDISNSLKLFTKAYNVVEQNFADPLDTDKALYKGAIPGVLRTLEPHSNFFDPKDFAQLMEDQKGRYYGVGMTVAQRNRK